MDDCSVSCVENTGRYQWCPRGILPYRTVGIGYRSSLTIFPEFSTTHMNARSAPARFTLTAAGFRDYSLQRVMPKLQSCRHKSFYDGAPAHTAWMTQRYLKTKKVKHIKLPAYSQAFQS